MVRVRITRPGQPARLLFIRCTSCEALGWALSWLESEGTTEFAVAVSPI